MKEIFASFARRKQAAGFDTVILGHSHIAAFEQNGAGTYVNLGDWINARTYLRWDSGKLSLDKWEDAPSVSTRS